MSDAKVDSLAGEDRSEWDRLWRAMPHRRLTSPPRLSSSYARFGKLISTTISQDPPEFSGRSYREWEICPICGHSTSDALRWPATIHATWEGGLSLGIGVWVHRRCFEVCPLDEKPAPIPW